MQKKWTYYARFYIRDHFLFLVKYAFQFQFWDPCVNLCNFLSIAIFWNFLPFFCNFVWQVLKPVFANWRPFSGTICPQTCRLQSISSQYFNNISSFHNIFIFTYLSFILLAQSKFSNSILIKSSHVFFSHDFADDDNDDARWGFWWCVESW